jgi:hypothetical protein
MRIKKAVATASWSFPLHPKTAAPALSFFGQPTPALK